MRTTFKTLKIQEITSFIYFFVSASSTPSHVMGTIIMMKANPIKEIAPTKTVRRGIRDIAMLLTKRDTLVTS